MKRFHSRSSVALPALGLALHVLGGCHSIFAYLAEYADFAKYLPLEPGSVGLRTWGRAASYDYLRVFEQR